jgi:branched-chain amino acid transport system permease protein
MSMSLYKKNQKVLIAIGLLLLVLFPILGPKYIVHIGVIVAINGIAVLGLGVLGGYAGQTSLGQAAFYGIGAYVSALLAINYGLPFWLGIIIAALVTGIAGLLVGIPTLRVSGLYLVMVTIGINEIVWLYMMNAHEVTRGSQGVLNIPSPSIGKFLIDSPRSYFFLAIIFLAVFIWLTVRIMRSRLGWYFSALNDSEIAASMVGINTVRSKIIAFVISAVWAGVAGALYAHYVGYIHPDNFKLDLSIMLLTMAVFGGQRSIVGMLLATVILTGTTEYLRNIGEYRLIAYGLFLLWGMIYMPNGIGPYLIRLPQYLANRLRNKSSKGV